MSPLVHGVLTAERDYAELYREVGPALWHAIYAYGGGQRDLAYDIVAEAFARALQYDRASNRPSSWLYRAAFRRGIVKSHAWAPAATTHDG